MNMKVVKLGMVRDLLAEWEKVRRHILAGETAGFHSMFCDSDGQETLFLGGVYKEDPEKALKATLKVSAARVLDEDEPLSQVSRF